MAEHGKKKGQVNEPAETADNAAENVGVTATGATPDPAQTHSFSRTVAKDHGEKAAVLLQYLAHHVSKSKNQRDGRDRGQTMVWTQRLRNSLSFFHRCNLALRLFRVPMRNRPATVPQTSEFAVSQASQPAGPRPTRRVQPVLCLSIRNSGIQLAQVRFAPAQAL